MACPTKGIAAWLVCSALRFSIPVQTSCAAMREVGSPRSSASASSWATSGSGRVILIRRLIASSPVSLSWTLFAPSVLMTVSGPKRPTTLGPKAAPLWGRASHGSGWRSPTLKSKRRTLAKTPLPPIRRAVAPPTRTCSRSAADNSLAVFACSRSMTMWEAQKDHPHQTVRRSNGAQPLGWRPRLPSYASCVAATPVGASSPTGMSLTRLARFPRPG